MDEEGIVWDCVQMRMVRDSIKGLYKTCDQIRHKFTQYLVFMKNCRTNPAIDLLTWINTCWANKADILAAL